MSLILEAVKSTIPQENFARPLQRVATCAFMTMVKSARLGICMTLSDDRIFEHRIHQPVTNLGEIETLGLKKILGWTDSLQGIERSFAVAAINSALPLDGRRYFAGNALELAARLGEGKRVAVVGHFPHMETIQHRALDFSVIEKRPQEGDFPAEDAVKIIPKADVVAMTGVTCLNDTIEGLLALKKPGSIFIIVGPSVPLSDALFDFGVDIIGGAWVEDEEDCYRRILQGAAPRNLPGMRNVLYPKNPDLFAGYEELIPPVK